MHTSLNEALSVFLLNKSDLVALSVGCWMCIRDYLARRTDVLNVL